jgi:hypothetical protein
MKRCHTWKNFLDKCYEVTIDVDYLVVLAWSLRPFTSLKSSLTADTTLLIALAGTSVWAAEST